MAETTATKVVRLEEQMKTVEQKVDKVDAKLDTLIDKVDALSDLRGEIDNLKQEVNALKLTASELAKSNAQTATELRAELQAKEKKDAVTRNITKAVIAAFSALFTYLLISYFGKAN